MAYERTLFERILKPNKPKPRTMADRKAQMTESIIRHLGRLLNAREGCCETVEDYGMPELDNWSGAQNELARQLERALRKTIQSYEPRLKKVKVRLIEIEEGRLVPKFNVSAELNVRQDFTKDVSFTTYLDPSGHVEVR